MKNAKEFIKQNPLVLGEGPIRWVCNNCYTENYKNGL